MHLCGLYISCVCAWDEEVMLAAVEENVGIPLLDTLYCGRYKCGYIIILLQHILCVTTA